MKCVKYCIMIALLGCLLVGCSHDIKTDEQVKALRGLDPEGLVQSKIWDEKRDEILKNDPLLRTQEPASTCLKDISNYYGYPANVLYVFKGNDDIGAITYMLDFDINSDSSVKNKIAKEIYPSILKDMILIFGDDFSGDAITTAEISQAIENHQIGSQILTWNSCATPKPTLTFSVFREAIFVMVGFEA